MATCDTLLLLLIYGVLNVLMSEAAALPPPTTSAPTTHIVSFFRQRKVKSKHGKMDVFDFESINSGPTADPLPQMLNKFVYHMDMDMDNSITTNRNDNSNLPVPIDDLLKAQPNTLEFSEEIDVDNDEIIPSMNMCNTSISLLNRVKQSIPVLEPVKHLLNSVRDGTFNPDMHSRNHHQLVSGTDTHNESSAIETEEEREMVNDSTGFKFLELLGTIAGMIWGFFTNFQKVFAASSGSASASLSGLSSSGN